MRAIPQETLDALTGSLVTPKLAVHAWYGGKLLQENLPVDQWSMSWDGKDTATVQGKLSISVKDADGTLSPWGWDEALSAGGTRLQTTLTLAEVGIDLGWWLTVDNSPEETWRVAGPGLEWVSSGASIPVNAEELTRLAQDYKFLAPEAAPSGATVVTELRRLLQEICPVIVGAGVVDKVIPLGFVYKDNRAAHVLDLLRSAGLWYRMTGDGAMEVYTQARTAPVWTIKGRAGGALVKVSRQQRRGDLLNAVASSSNDPSVEIKRLATLDNGPLRYGGPVGWLSEERTALATSISDVQDDADRHLSNSLAAKTLALKVVCVPHPGIQIGDWVRVAHPTIDGQEFPLDGIVTYVQLSGGAEGMDPMQLTVEVSADDAQRVRNFIRRNQ